MGYKADDESLFSNKNKITLDRYNNLRKGYDDVIKKYNAINLIYDNPTATGYPYGNEKQSSTEIPLENRDKNTLSFKGIDYSSFEKKYTTHGEYSFTIQKGYYEITMISAGAGGFATYGSGYNKYSQYPGCSGAMYKFIIYAQSAGTMNVVVGKGGPRFIRNDANTGKYHREQPIVDGGDTTVKFKGNLVANCRGGGRLQYLFRTHNHDCDIENIGIFDKEHVNKLGSYIIKLEQFKDNVYNIGPVNDYDKGKIKDTGWNYFGANEERNGAGGRAWANPGVDPKTNDDTYIKEYTKDGKDGYFEIKSINSNYGFLEEGINVESKKIHTLGNENEIRRKFNTALKKIYNKLSSTTKLTKDSCLEIGEIVGRVNSNGLPIINNNDNYGNLKKYDKITVNNSSTKLENAKIDNINYLDSSNLIYIEEDKSGVFPVDKYAYIVDYDNNIRKVKIEKLNDSHNGIITHNIDENYASYKNENDSNDIIYIKKSNVNKTGNISVYKYNEETNKYVLQSNKGKFDIGDGYKYESNKGNVNFDKTLNGNYRVICIGAGGGSVSVYHTRKTTAYGAGGGSGSGFDCILKLNGTYKIKVGKGGDSQALRTSSSSYNQKGTNGGDTRLGNCIAYGGKSGHDGGKTVGAGGDTPTIPYEIISTTFKKKGNNGKKETRRWYANAYGGDAIYTAKINGNSYLCGKGGFAQGNKETALEQIPGKDGYIYIESVGTGKFIYNNSNYIACDIPFEYGGIKWNDYQYDLQKLNRLKEYVATKDSWFDDKGYCKRSCQINCQTSVQKS